MNVLQLGPTGHAVAKWCFTPKGYLVIGDVLLAQKIALETMELKALEVANKYRAGKCPSGDFLIPLSHLDSMGPIMIWGGASIVDGQEPGEV